MMLPALDNSELLWSVLVVEGFGAFLMLIVSTCDVVWSNIERL